MASTATEPELDPVEVMLAEIARRVRIASEEGRWATFELTLKAGRPEVLREGSTTRIQDLTD